MRVGVGLIFAKRDLGAAALAGTVAGIDRIVSVLPGEVLPAAERTGGILCRIFRNAAPILPLPSAANSLAMLNEFLLGEKAPRASAKDRTQARRNAAQPTEAAATTFVPLVPARFVLSYRQFVRALCA